MTTFIDFRYSRALAAALFAGQEKEENEIEVAAGAENYFVLEVDPASQAHIAGLRRHDGSVAATLEICDGNVIHLRRGDSTTVVRAAFDHPATGHLLVGVRIGPDRAGLRIDSTRFEADLVLVDSPDRLKSKLTLHLAPHVRVMGRGTGRVNRWGELFYKREHPTGLCVELTMDWHHLRAGIPLFGTMTAEHLLEQGKFRLRFRSYAYEAHDAEATDFVRLFACDDPAEIAVHLSPALYTARATGIPNLAFGVVEAGNVQQHIVDRYNRMDAVVVPSQFAANAFKRSGVTRPIHVVSHGVDTKFFAPPEIRTPLPGGRKFNFLAIGTHVERKNFMHLVRAFLEEFRDSEDVALFLLLRPEYHTTQNNVALEFTEWERTWARDSAPIFLWTGYLTREHLRDFYAHANAYVMPSNEGFGLTLLEAMSCGNPVIGLSRGGVRDFLHDDTGYVVKSSRAYKATDIDTLPYVGDRFHQPNAKHLRSVMRHVTNHEDEARVKARRGRALCEARLTWEHVTRAFSDTIEVTHAAFHTARRSLTTERQPFAWVLCIEDDEPAKRSLDYLKSLRDSSTRVLCLFTRYARLSDVNHARDNGFVTYRWDGTPANAHVIARGVLGRSWIGILRPGEEVDGDQKALHRFIQSLPATVGEVDISVNGKKQPRIVRLQPSSVESERVEYSDIRITA